MPKRETYPEARTRLFSELRAFNFEVKDKLKVPQVKIIYGYLDTNSTDPNNVRTLYFNAQSVHLDDLSTELDIRGMSADTLLAIVTEIHQSRLKIGR